MRIVFLDADDVRIRFEAACNRLGEGDARRAFSMALNKEGRKSFTAMRRALSLWVTRSVRRAAAYWQVPRTGPWPTRLSPKRLPRWACKGCWRLPDLRFWAA